jgi:hypothetical protein
MIRKPEDKEAEAIEFGVELETFIPNECGVAVGQYHVGSPVTSGRAAGNTMVNAPSFEGRLWHADRDASITAKPGFMPAEFVSPVLKGAEGVCKLRDFVRFANSIGAQVNASCGCHVTVGIKSVIGAVDLKPAAAFIRKLVRVAHHRTWAIYAQTGTDRHVSTYCKQLPKEAGAWTNELIQELNANPVKAAQKGSEVQVKCGRGMLNMLKLFPLRDASAIEFRAFAGTTNEHKVLHHVATCLGIMRRAHTLRASLPYTAPDQRKPETAQAALQALWLDLGWLEDSPGLDCALGQFGILHSEFETYSKVALRMAEKFEAKYPQANL